MGIRFKKQLIATGLMSGVLAVTTPAHALWIPLAFNADTYNISVSTSNNITEPVLNISNITFTGAAVPLMYV